MLTPQTYTLHALSIELQRDIRLLGRALANTPADESVGRRKRWYLKTALAALANYERAIGSANADSARSNGVNANLDLICDEVTQAAAALEAALDALEAEPDVVKRRIMAKPYGKLIGRYHTALERSAALMPPSVAALSEPYRANLVTSAAGRFMDLLQWRVAN